MGKDRKKNQLKSKAIAFINKDSLDTNNHIVKSDKVSATTVSVKQKSITSDWQDFVQKLSKKIGLDLSDTTVNIITIVILASAGLSIKKIIEYYSKNESVPEEGDGERIELEPQLESIGINFRYYRDQNQVFYGEKAGHPNVAQYNWNNTDGHHTGLWAGRAINNNGEDIVNFDIGWKSNSTRQLYKSLAGPTPNHRLMNGYLDAHYSQAAENPSGNVVAAVEFSNIPYAKYDVYVYYGSNVEGSLGAIKSKTTTAGKTFYYRTWSSALYNKNEFEFKMTNQEIKKEPPPLSNYCIFSNQTSPTFSVEVGSHEDNFNITQNSGIHGIQIVNTE
jgi:hypothetical protein